MVLFKHIIIFFTSVFLFLSCKSEKDDTIHFPNTYQLTGESMHVSAILGRTLMFKVKDNKLILKDENENSFITIIDIENPENYIYLSQKGEGPRELTNPSRIFINEDGFSIFDLGKLTLFYFNMQEIQDSKYSPKPIFTTDISAIVTWEQLTDSVYVTTGLFPENRFYFFDNYGHLIAQEGSYPFKFDRDYPFHVKGMASISGLVKSPKENKIATSTVYGGHIGIYQVDLSELTCNTVSEINLFSPQFTTYDYMGTPNFLPTEDTRLGYISIAADDNYIYALYSGKPDRPGEEFSGETVHVFDWEGKPAYEIILDNPAWCLDVYQDKAYTLYTTENGSFDVAVYVLP